MYKRQADTEKEESEDILKKDGNVTPGSTYAAATSIGLNTTYNATTSRTSVTHWYKFTMSKAGMVQLKFAHANLSSASNSTAWRIDFIADQVGGLVTVTSGMQDTQNQTAKIGLDAGTYYVQITGTGVLTVGSAAYSFSVQYEDTYCETEQNNTIATADNYDRLGQTITGSISSASDTDYYKITSTTKGYLSFQLQHDKVSGRLSTDIYSVAVCDAAGNTMYTMTSKKDEEKTESVNFGLDAGTYYLKVQAYAKNAVEKEYTLCVNKIENRKTSVTSVKSTAYNKLKVSWKVVPAAASYQIYRSTKKDGDYQHIKTIDSVGTSSWTDSSVKTGKTYYYKIKTVVKTQNGEQTSGFSNVKSAKAVPAKTTLKAKASDAKNVKLTWSKVKGVSGYEIYRSNSKDGKYSKVKTISKGSTTSYKNGKLKKSTTYYYKIRAYRKVNGKKVYGSYSSVVSVKTKAK